MDGFNMMNLPYFLHQILIKMVACARKWNILYPYDVYHHALIQIMYLHALNKKTQQPRKRVMRQPFAAKHKKERALATEAESSHQVAAKSTHSPNRRKIPRLNTRRRRGQQTEVQDNNKDETIGEFVHKGEDLGEIHHATEYSKMPRTRPTNKLRLGLKAKLNPKLKEPIFIIDEQ